MENRFISVALIVTMLMGLSACGGGGGGGGGGGAPTPTPIPKVTTLAGNGAASFRSYTFIAVDSIGNIYVADTDNNKIRKITPAGEEMTLAGSGAQGSADGEGAAASFYYPSGLTVDNNGNIYVADSSNNKIRKITATGDVSTLAGSGAQGNTDGAGDAASFYYPGDVAADNNGNVYVADTFNNKIRKVTATGDVSTLAGSGAQGSADGVGTAATFDHPSSVAVDSAGNVYVMDFNNVRKITLLGEVTTLAGNGGPGHADGSGAAASFYAPHGIALDNAGNVYVADSFNNEIRKVTPTGDVTTLAGSIVIGGVDGVGAAARFDQPMDVAVDNNGNIYVTDSHSKAIRKISAAAVVTTLRNSLSGADGNGPTASFLNPASVAVDSTGNVYVADSGFNSVRKISPEGNVTTLAGNGMQGSADGSGATASFSGPGGVAVDNTGTVYVADSFNNKIRKITPAGEVSTLAGSGVQGNADGIGAAASFNEPGGVAVDNNGNVYVADTSNHKIRKIMPTGEVTTLSGSGTPGSANGIGTAASFNLPGGIAVDNTGNIYVADTTNHEIRKITPAGEVTTLAGQPPGVCPLQYEGCAKPGHADGIGLGASFFYPGGVAVDNAGNVYVADTFNSEIRKITPAGQVTTLAGILSACPLAIDGSATVACFSSPTGVAVDNAGNIYVADTRHNLIRKLVGF